MPRTSVYLIIGQREQYKRCSHRLTQKVPSLKSYEVAVKIELDLPDTLFRKPTLSAKVTVPEDAVSSPVIDATVVDNIQEIMSKELGVDMTVSVVENEDA